MRIALVAPTAIPIPVTGYSGIEREVQYLADALGSMGHDVTVYCKLSAQDGNAHPWARNAVNISIENEIIDHIEELQAFDVVHDWSHTKPLRLAKLGNYLATTMWTDAQGTRNVFPSRAVAEAFGKPSAAVVPLGLPTSSMPEPIEPDGYFLCFSRIAPYKGVDIAIDIAARHHIPLTVAGHTGHFADRYYAMKMRYRCRELGFSFVADPEGDQEVIALMRHATGMIHLHRWLESFSLAIAQALCMGVPVLTSDRGGPKEYVNELAGGTIVHFEDGKEAELVHDEAVRSFLHGEFTLEERIGLAQRAREMFDINRIARLYVDIYGGQK